MDERAREPTADGLCSILLEPELQATAEAIEDCER
tara:strand:+ start:1145 stop:1249 length:105 start_codon:yes stop_codon:yes gene_type:complete